MVKFYLTILTSLILLPSVLLAKPRRATKDFELKKGFVTLNIDNSKNGNQPIEAAYVILDKYNRTGAGYVSKKFEVEDNKIYIDNLQEGKYYVDIYTKGFYKQHFTKVITVSKKGSTYTFKMEETDTFVPTKANIPAESADFSNTSIVKMK